MGVQPSAAALMVIVARLLRDIVEHAAALRLEHLPIEVREVEPIVGHIEVGQEVRRAEAVEAIVLQVALAEVQAACEVQVVLPVLLLVEGHLLEVEDRLLEVEGHLAEVVVDNRSQKFQQGLVKLKIVRNEKAVNFHRADGMHFYKCPKQR